MDVSFRGRYDKKTFSQALELTEKRSILSKVFRYFALVLAIVIVGGTIYAWIFEGGMEPSDIGRSIRNIVTAAFIGYFYAGGTISRNRSINHLFRHGPTRGMQGIVTRDGIGIGTQENHVLLKWEQFVSKGEKGQLLALRMIDGSVAVFQRDFFSTESDWQRFRQLVNQKVIEPK